MKARESKTQAQLIIERRETSLRRRRALWAAMNGAFAGIVVYWSTRDIHLACAALWIVALLTKS